MVLSDRMVRVWAQRCVNPYDKDCVNSASYDLKIGNSYIDLHTGETHTIDEDNPLVLHPPSTARELLYRLKCILFPFKKFRHPATSVLVVTHEQIFIPQDIGGDVKLKTTPARKGANHTLAGWIDPGYFGRLTLTLHATHTVVLKHKQRVCQVVLYRLEEPCQVPYDRLPTSGHYQGQVGPTVAIEEIIGDRNE